MVSFALEKLVSLVSFHLLVVVQSLGGVWLFVTPWTAACQASLSFTISLEFPQIHVYWVNDTIQPSHLCCPLLLLPSIFSSIKVFSNKLVLRIRKPKYWSFSFSISPSNEYLRLVSFTIDCFDLCSPRDSQESSPEPQFERINSSVLSLLYGPTLNICTWLLEKPTALTRQTFCWQSDVSAF